jgi:hypothetical protein
MYLITNLNYNQNNYSFTWNNIGHELINASQYVASDDKFKWKNPHPTATNERFILIGDGNYVIKNEQLIQQVAIVIIQKIDDNSNYAIQRIDFQKEFTLV